MNKLLVLLTAFIVSSFFNITNAQTTTDSQANTEQTAATRRFYLEIQGVQNQLSAQAFEIRFVPGKLFLDFSKTKNADFVALRDKYQIRSLIDALNILSLYGWQLSECYATVLNGSTVNHWIVYKDAATPDELALGIISDKASK